MPETVKTQSKRDQLVDAAARLFEQGGYHATGIEAIIAEAGVAKMTLYKHFQSKDELIVAALQRRAELAMACCTQAIEEASDTPRGRLLAIFDTAETRCAESGFTGCLFQRAAGEFSDPDSPVVAAAKAFGRMFTAYVAGLAKDAGAKDPAALAGELWVLYSGCMTLSRMQSCGDAFRVARGVAERLVADTVES